MNTENLSTLKIHKLSSAQYWALVDAGTVDPYALYLTPDDVSSGDYVTIDQWNEKADLEHPHTVSDITDIQDTLDNYYSKDEIDISNQGILESIGDIIDGTTSVANAIAAETAKAAEQAEFATKAACDNAGNDITTTYETQEMAKQKLQDANSEAQKLVNAVVGEASETFNTLKKIEDQIGVTNQTLSDLNGVVNGKQDNITGAASSITSNDLASDLVLVSNSTGKVSTSNISTEELACLAGATSQIQVQLDNKVDKTTLSQYYTTAEIDAMEFITTADIDEICGTAMAMASEVTY